MGYAILLVLTAALIAFISLFAFSDHDHGSITEGMADLGAFDQGCLGSCIMLPMISVALPFELLLPAFSAASLGKDKVKRRSVLNMTIAFLITTPIFGALLYISALNQ